MPYPYVTQKDVEDRISPVVVRRILDDRKSGAADPDAVSRVIRDASAKVAGTLRGIYDLDVVASNTPEEVKRLTLDGVHAYLCQRHAEFVKGDWVEMMKLWRADLKDLREGRTRLDVVGPPEPPANVGTEHVDGDPDDFVEDDFRTNFTGGFGDF